ncbi:peptidoglycan-binding protein [Actinocorallia aurantiaca]|uniref:Peptidoglycan-binding protein n=1 Tax=Actinocorallia aurantiaca TaxID=46204 RepID=A0ABP6GEB4_9ACTN
MRRSQPRRGRAALWGTALLALGAAAVTATGFGFQNDDGSADAHSALPPATAEVTKKTLVDTRTESGDLGYASARTVNTRLNGTVTALSATGSTVKRGKALYRLDDDPVVLLYGRLPSYRALSTGVEGADVEQFEKNLWALGYRGFTVDDEYTYATGTAVKEWQEDLGLAETGTVEESRVVYAYGPVRISAHDAEIGEDVRPGAAVLTCTETERAVTVELEASDQELARKGTSVDVELPNGKTIRGKVSEAETVIEAAEKEGDEAETKLEVTVVLLDEKELKGLGLASVDVVFTASRRKDVLAVPVASLLALSEGGHGLEVVEGTTTRILAVETGLFADGWVEVSGDGLTEGMKVGTAS